MMESAPTTQSSQKAQRRTVLVKRSLQLKYIGLIFISVVLAFAIMGLDLYHTLYRLIPLDNPSLVPLLEYANSIFLLRIAVYLAIVFLLSLYISHRLAGPIYRFEKSAQIVSSGNLTHRVSLRTGDELLELQEEFNSMVSSLQSLVQRDRNLIQRLSSRLGTLQQGLSEKADAKEVREEIQAIQSELEHLTSSFRV